MIAMPMKAAAVAPRVQALSRSPRISQANAAVTKGIAASITITSATAVSRMAFRKHTVATAEQIATSAPSQPMARIERHRCPRSCRTTTTARKPPPNRPRQNRSAQASTGMRRVKKPAVLYAAADASSSAVPSNAALLCERDTIDLHVERAEPAGLAQENPRRLVGCEVLRIDRVDRREVGGVRAI